MMKRLLSLLSLVIACVGMGWAGSAHAEAGLQLNPLKYEDLLQSTNVKSGFIDVSNPSDTTVTISTDVQGFRQADLDGNLEFFHDDQIAAGITPGLDQFELGPRESIRVAFTVNPGKLPQGGVYAAIFFRTVPPVPDAKVSYVAESASVGTLLILRNGNAGDQTGKVTKFALPFWQFGSGLRGQLQYQNINRDTGGLAFTPQLESRVALWGRASRFTGPFIMPQSTRQFSFNRPGSYLGLLPVTVLDASTGHPVTRWVFALTGRYQVILLLLVVLSLFTPMAWWRRGKKPVVKRPMDGLGPRAK